MREEFDDPPEFTDEQARQALKEIGQNARQEAFAAGLPVAIYKNGKVVLLYADGREEDAAAIQSRNGTQQK